MEQMEDIYFDSFWFQLLKNDSERKIWHPEIEIIFLLQGKGRIYFSDLKTVYTLKEKDILVVNAFEVQEFELDYNGTALSFMISPEFVQNVAPELLRYRINCRSFLHVEEKQQAYNVLRRDLAKAFLEFYKKEAENVYLKGSVAAILGDLEHYFLDKSQLLENSGIQATMKTLTHYIHEHYKEHLTLDELAKHTYLSKTYISRCFSRCFGVSFTAYLDLLRLTLAVQLLKGQGNLTDIAEECGFANVNAMIQAFKRYRGMTPGEYRRMEKQEEINFGNMVEWFRGRGNLSDFDCVYTKYFFTGRGSGKSTGSNIRCIQKERPPVQSLEKAVECWICKKSVRREYSEGTSLSSEEDWI